MKNKDQITFANLKSVYQASCGGTSCSGKNVTWWATSAAAVAVFGAGSPKATAWGTQGNNFGVNF